MVLRITLLIKKYASSEVGNLARKCQRQKFYSEFQIYLFILFVVDRVY